MPQQNFGAQVSAWVAESKTRIKAVRDESVQRVIAIAQTPVAAGGNMPVDTGFLRASGQATSNGQLPPLANNPNPVGTFSYDEASVALVITNAKLEDTISFGYTANYAIFQEYGTMHMAGHRFVGLAAQQWPQIVEQVSKEAQARFG